MPAGYIIASVTATNPEQYKEYKKWSTAAIQAHGAEIGVGGGRCRHAHDVCQGCLSACTMVFYILKGLSL